MLGDAKLVLLVLILEVCVGYPRVLLAAIGHPVMWIGKLIDALERVWNRPRFSDGARRCLGVVAIVIVLALAAGAGLAITLGTSSISYGGVLWVVVATAGLAQRSLYQHVRPVEIALTSNELDGARAAVGRIVGRDTANLSAADVSGAAIESLAESFNDAVVAPAFWLFVGGLPGLLAYKALNTADSMIGHMEPRWRVFGWAAARLDDVANLVPARIAGALLATAGALGAGAHAHADAQAQAHADAGAGAGAGAGAIEGAASADAGTRTRTRARTRGFRAMWRDARKHASPNAGWPEAAAAGSLNLRLGGPAYYDGVMHVRPSFGDGATPRPEDLRRALMLYKKACAALWTVLGVIALAQFSM